MHAYLSVPLWASFPLDGELPWEALLSGDWSRLVFDYFGGLSLADSCVSESGGETAPSNVDPSASWSQCVVTI